MLRLATLVVSSAILFAGGERMRPATASTADGAASGAAPHVTEVPAVLGAARGANPLLCALAARALGNWGWGNTWGSSLDGPVTPLSGALRAAPDSGRADADDGDDGGDDEDDDGARAARRRAGRPVFSDADRALLLQSLGSDDACVRELSVRFLGHERGSVVTGAVVGRLGDAATPTRESAALVLGLIGDRAAGDALARALADRETGVRANAAWALGRLRDGRALAGLERLFADASPLVREAAVGAVGQLDSSSATAALARVVRQDQSPRVRRVAAWALGNVRDRGDAATDALAAALAGDASASVREMAAWALGNVRGRAGSAALQAAARKDADAGVRETAVWALAESGDRGAVETLGAVVSGDADSRVRGTAAWALGNVRDGSRQAPAGLLKALGDESDDTRLKAAWALGQIGDAGATGAIKAAMKNEKNARVQKALIRALMRSGDRDEATYTELLNSKDEDVREAAVRGLAGASSFNPWPWPWPRPRPFP